MRTSVGALTVVSEWLQMLLYLCCWAGMESAGRGDFLASSFVARPKRNCLVMGLNVLRNQSDNRKEKKILALPDALCSLGRVWMTVFL